MWIFKDDNENAVTQSKIDYTDDPFQPGIAARISPPDRYLIDNFLLERENSPTKVGFIFIVGSNAAPETWVNIVKRNHSDWNIKAYKVIGVEWE